MAEAAEALAVELVGKFVGELVVDRPRLVVPGRRFPELRMEAVEFAVELSV